jgi:hypothetical protein
VSVADSVRGLVVGAEPGFVVDGDEQLHPRAARATNATPKPFTQRIVASRSCYQGAHALEEPHRRAPSRRAGSPCIADYSLIGSDCRIVSKDMASLIQYWFEFEPSISHMAKITPWWGVTAWTVEDALSLISLTGRFGDSLPVVTRLVESVDISTLDQNHVITNMNPPKDRGIWYPKGYQ